MNKTDMLKKVNAINEKEANKIASLIDSVPPNTDMPNTNSEFISKVYLAKRTYLVRIPARIAKEHNLQAGMLVKMKILEGVACP